MVIHEEIVWHTIQIKSFQCNLMMNKAVSVHAFCNSERETTEVTSINNMFVFVGAVWYECGLSLFYVFPDLASIGIIACL